MHCTRAPFKEEAWKKLDFCNFVAAAPGCLRAVGALQERTGFLGNRCCSLLAISVMSLVLFEDSLRVRELFPVMLCESCGLYRETIYRRLYYTGNFAMQYSKFSGLSSICFL